MADKPKEPDFKGLLHAAATAQEAAAAAHGAAAVHHANAGAAMHAAADQAPENEDEQAQAANGPQRSAQAPVGAAQRVLSSVRANPATARTFRAATGRR